MIRSVLAAALVLSLGGMTTASFADTGGKGGVSSEAGKSGRTETGGKGGKSAETGKAGNETPRSTRGN